MPENPPLLCAALHKWKGYPNSENLWIPFNNLHSPTLVAYFHACHPSAPAPHPQQRWLLRGRWMSGFVTLFHLCLPQDLQTPHTPPLYSFFPFTQLVVLIISSTDNFISCIRSPSWVDKEITFFSLSLTMKSYLLVSVQVLPPRSTSGVVCETS